MEFAANECSLFELFDSFIERVKWVGVLMVSVIIGNIFSAILTFCFAFVSVGTYLGELRFDELAYFLLAVGTFLGAMTGAFIGQETESGFIRGAAVGAMSGAVFSIEVFEYSLNLWRSNESGIDCLLYLIDVITSLMSGRLVRERIGPAMLSAVQSQIGSDEMGFYEFQNFYDIGDTRGLSVVLVENIPTVSITSNDNFDASGDRVSCSVCLQDLQVGESVRRLPHCHHMFHLPCIDKWLIKHGSCPLCRRDV